MVKIPVDFTYDAILKILIIGKFIEIVTTIWIANIAAVVVVVVVVIIIIIRNEQFVIQEHLIIVLHADKIEVEIEFW